jgi:hypothetical protein
LHKKDGKKDPKALCALTCISGFYPLVCPTQRVHGQFGYLNSRVQKLGRRDKFLHHHHKVRNILEVFYWITYQTSDAVLSAALKEEIALFV